MTKERMRKLFGPPPNDLGDRPLTDGTPFPFGRNRERNLTMQEVPLAWYRFFIQQWQDAAAWARAWPNVKHYADTILADEIARAVAAPRKSAANVTGSLPRAATSKSTASAQAAFEEFKRQTKNL